MVMPGDNVAVTVKLITPIAMDKELKDHTRFSDKGNEIAFGTIGDASTSEGHRNNFV